MAGVSIDDFGASMIHYLPGVVETLNTSSMMRDLMKEAKDVKWEGSFIQFFVHVALNNGMGYREDGGAIPVAQKQDYVPAKAYRRFLTGSISATDGILLTAASSSDAAIDVVKSELRGFTRAITALDEFFAFRDGTGIVATVQATTATGTGVTVKVNDARMCRDKAVLEVYDSTLATLKGYFTVTRVTRALDASGFFQVVGNLTSSTGSTIATDVLVWQSSLNKAPTGLSKLIDDTSTTFQNINTATYTRYTSPVLDNAGVLRQLTPNLMRQIMAMVNQESGREPGQKWTAMGSSWLGIEFEKMFQGDVRLTPSDKVGGVSIAQFQSSYGKIQYVAMPYAPYNTMFFADFGQIHRAVQKEGDFRRNPGGGIFAKAGPNLAWSADWLEVQEYFIKQRNTSGRIDDLSESPQTGH